jgi:hypothetical protein
MRSPGRSRCRQVRESGRPGCGADRRAVLRKAQLRAWVGVDGSSIERDRHDHGFPGYFHPAGICRGRRFRHGGLGLRRPDADCDGRLADGLARPLLSGTVSDSSHALGGGLLLSGGILAAAAFIVLFQREPE